MCGAKNRTSQLASCLINAQLLSAHRPAADNNSLIGCTGHELSVPISLTADAHFSARLGAFFYWTRCFENNVPFDNTTPIYLINLLWKLGLSPVHTSNMSKQRSTCCFDMLNLNS